MVIESTIPITGSNYHRVRLRCEHCLNVQNDMFGGDSDEYKNQVPHVKYCDACKKNSKRQKL